MGIFNIPAVSTPPGPSWHARYPGIEHEIYETRAVNQTSELADVEAELRGILKTRLNRLNQTQDLIPLNELYR